MRKRLAALLAIVGIAAGGCNDTFESSLPEVTVRFTCSLAQAPYYRLTTPGQFLKVTENPNHLPVGYGGIIIGQSIYSDGNDYVAFDAACPVEARRDVSVEVQDDGLGTAICPTCHTQYNLSLSGAPVEGEGTEYLKHYSVSVSGTTLIVTN